MKIRFLHANAYVGGGATRTTLSSAWALAERGHDVEVVSVLRRREVATFPVHPRVRVIPLVDEWSFKREPEPRAPVKRAVHASKRFALERSTILGNRHDGRTKEWHWLSDVRMLRWLRSVHDGVIIGTRPAINLAIARYADPRVVRVAQDHMNLDSYRPKLRTAIQRQYGDLDAVVTLTERDAEEYAALLNGSTRVLSVPNGVPETSGVRASLDSNVVITAGRLTRQKGYDRLLPAWAKVAAQRPGWQLQIYGAGPKDAPLQQQIDELAIGDTAQLMGRTSEMFERMSESAFFVMTSRKEGLPMVLLEAMGIGLPVISYDCPTGPRDVISDGVDGFVVPDGDEDALVARMIELMDDVEQRKRFGAAALEKAVEYDVYRLAERWEGLFDELAAAKPSR
jgi:glycosyltransferase involved in cell wall biosynthesis